MKKRIAALLAAVCLTLCIAPPRALAVSDVCFVSVNDRLLELSSRAENVGGGWYVPCTAFADFGINYSYFSNSSTAMLFTAAQQFFFDMNNGTTYDASNNYYSAAGTLINGVAYVPVSFVCAQFGLAWSFIVGNGSGNICRIKDGSAVLSDSQFLSAASSQMTAKYSAYMNAVNPVTSTSSNQTTQPAGTKTVYLSFQGLPEETVLEQLKAKNMTAAFFLTPEEIKKAPYTVRQVVGGGNYVGILCADYTDFRVGAELLYEAAHTMTVLAAAQAGEEDACRAMADKNGLVFCDYGVDAVLGGKGLTSASVVTGRLATGENYVRIQCTADTAGNIATLLNYFSGNKCLVLPVNEVHNG